MRKLVTALVGAQYGSEGKGVIAAHLANDYGVHVRTGGPNAGHTFVHDGKKYVARGLPVGWINPYADLVIGPGAVVDLELLVTEVQDAEERSGMSIRNRLWVDRKAHVVTGHQHGEEGGVDGRAHEKIGSTGEGVGLARMARISRGVLIRDLAWATAFEAWKWHLENLKADLFAVTDTVPMVNRWIDSGRRVLLEGTQGSGLSLIHGPWPYVTSHDTNAAQLAADAGIAPGLVDSVLVARTFPIRVAGPSGPLKGETTWEALGVTPETTTVTKKVRRVGSWDASLLDKAIQLNRPVGLAVTFIDYLFPEDAGKSSWDDLTAYAQRWIRQLEHRHSTPVMWCSTGPAGTGIIDVPINREIAVDEGMFLGSGS